jgi:hypothetical protein
MRRRAMTFLWTVARTLVKNAANSLSGIGLGDSIIEILAEWNKRTSTPAGTIQELGKGSVHERGDETEKIVEEVASNQNPEVRVKVKRILEEMLGVVGGRRLGPFQGFTATELPEPGSFSLQSLMGRRAGAFGGFGEVALPAFEVERGGWVQ